MTLPIDMPNLEIRAHPHAFKENLAHHESLTLSQEGILRGAQLI